MHVAELTVNIMAKIIDKKVGGSSILQRASCIRKLMTLFTGRNKSRGQNLHLIYSEIMNSMPKRCRLGH